MTGRAAVTGDFVLAFGHGAREWLLGLRGFEVEAGEAGGHAIRGEALSGRRADGGRWLALADLVEGRVEDAFERTDKATLPQALWRGRFALASASPDGGVFEICSDHFGSLPLYWCQHGGMTAVATDLRLLLDAPGIDREPDPTAVYHYLNFACIPAPHTICRGIHRLEPGTRLRLQDGASRGERYYLPEYPVDLHGSDAALADGLRERIVASVRDYRPDDNGPDGNGAWGCFLSGGTDSSSIVSILARQRPGVQTCSIGFEEAGYDELEFARIASEACGAQPHLDRVDRTRAMALLDDVLDTYDQPFGNASAIPTLACAELGRARGFDTMLGGDGGDEIFGGNQRYAKDKVMEAFYRLPSPLKAAARAAGRALGGNGNLTLNRVRNFTHRASLPNPDRFYTDDSFASDFRDELLTEDFRRQVPQDASLEFMRGVYAQGEPAEPLHRIMRLDLLMAIAQNDLVKVHRACRHHGIAARFPYLDPRLVEHCGRLPARYKVRGTRKRYLFKQAMDGILPQAILRKPKQGFGLPTAVWMKEDPALKSLVRETLLDGRARARGWIDRGFVARLLELHMAGGWDHSAAIWQLLVLELWMRRYMDA